MKNLYFTIWMLGFPLICTIDSYLNEYLLKKTYSDGMEWAAAIIIIIIWFFVGFKLYEKSP